MKSNTRFIARFAIVAGVPVVFDPDPNGQTPLMIPRGERPTNAVSDVVITREAGPRPKSLRLTLKSKVKSSPPQDS